jgi:hypothetical protein
MDLDNINDIDILRNKLKEYMIKCKKNFSYKDFEICEGKWYYINQDEGGIYIIDDNKHIYSFDNEEMSIYFELPKY